MAADNTPGTTPPKASKKPSAAPRAAAPPVAEPVAVDAAASSTSSATAAASNAVNVVRERLQAGEQLALSGAGLIVAVWIIFDLIFDFRTISSFTLLMAVFMVLAIWVHRWGQYDFGNGYRIVIGALGVALALFSVVAFLITIRTGINAGAMQLLGLLLFWVAGVVAGYGAWLVFRIREE